MEFVREVRLSPSDILNSLKISNSEFLNELNGRTTCPKCGKSRKYFCYTCYIPMKELENLIPTVQLPLKIDIIKHPQEVDGKSTAAHVAVIASNDVEVYTYPNFPDYEDKSEVLLIFPGKNALTLTKLVEKYELLTVEKSFSCLKPINNCHEHIDSSDTENGGNCGNCGIHNKSTGNINNESSNLTKEDTSGEVPDKFEKQKMLLSRKFPFKRIILIDSTWKQITSIRSDARLEGIQRVELTERESCFWRFQRGKPRTYLSTVEAVYYFLVDVHKMFISTEYNAEYDNLLFFFKYMFNKIHTLYKVEELRAYSTSAPQRRGRKPKLRNQVKEPQQKPIPNH